MAFNEPDRKLLKALARVLMGDPEDRNDLGLVGDVKENSQFRRSLTELGWILVPLMIVTLGTTLFALITGGSQ